MRQEDPVRAPVGDAEARPDGVRERVVDADERVGEGQPRDRRRVGHRGARLQVGAVANARGSASRIRWMACMQNASVYGEAKIDTPASSACVSASTPVSAVMCGGIVSVSAGSTIAMSGTSE